MQDGGGYTGPTTAGRPILVCIVAIASMTLIALVGMVTGRLPGDQLIIILGLIAGVGGFGAGAHLAAAERTRSSLELTMLLRRITEARPPAMPAER